MAITLPKFVSEIVRFDFDYSLDPAVATDPLTSVSSVSYTPNDGSLTITAGTVITNTLASALFQGGTAGTTYNLVCYANTNGGQLVGCPGRLVMRPSC